MIELCSEAWAPSATTTPYPNDPLSAAVFSTTHPSSAAEPPLTLTPAATAAVTHSPRNLTSFAEHTLTATWVSLPSQPATGSSPGAITAPAASGAVGSD